MADRFIAGILTSFMFTFGTAFLYFQDRFFVIPGAMFIFPTVFLLGIPQSFVIDWIVKRLPLRRGSVLFLLEALLYIVAGVIATMLLFFMVTRSFTLVLPEFYVLGVAASLLYFVCLYALRRKKKAQPVA
ncbi:hypothetical protein [Brevibacillus sp. 179-C9.3 HS]|uniref:hypothetical protein n=1 Tax=unclassified Brevibacillus TaxID=2684853 RepID=UPI0039A11677